MRLIFLILIFALCLSFPFEVSMVNMTSENYKIEVDVISVGGDLTTSTNYKLFETVGESSGVEQTTSTSSNYIIYAGFQAMATSTYLTATLSANAVSLGTLSPNAVSSASQTLTVSTNAPAGYTTTIAEDGELRSGGNDINDVADGAVSVSSEEYGIRTSGTAGQMNNADTAITAVAQNAAASSTAAVGEQTTITYKASVSANTAYGDYSHSVTFTTTANY